MPDEKYEELLAEEAKERLNRLLDCRPENIDVLTVSVDGESIN